MLIELAKTLEECTDYTTFKHLRAAFTRELKRMETERFAQARGSYPWSNNARYNTLTKECGVKLLNALTKEYAKESKCYNKIELVKRFRDFGGKRPGPDGWYILSLLDCKNFVEDYFSGWIKPYGT